MFKGDKILIRAIEPEDADLIWKWENDSTLWRVSHTKAPFSKKLIYEYVNTAHDIHKHQQIRWMIVNAQNNEPVGTLDFFDYDSFHQRAGVGILIADKEDRQKGYAKEALELGMQYAFDFLLLKNVFCNILADNTASHELFKSLGFENVGVKKEWCKTNNGWQDEWMYQIVNKRIE